MDVNKELKLQIFNKCLAMQTTKVETLKKAMDDAQESANSEEKSSAGDKYETARAMSQNVRDMNAKQLNDALKELSILQQIKTDLPHQAIKTGSLVSTSTGLYFIAISIGEITVNDKSIFIISPISPLAQSMLEKKAGEKVNFRGKEVLINAVF